MFNIEVVVAGASFKELEQQHKQSVDKYEKYEVVKVIAAAEIETSLLYETIQLRDHEIVARYAIAQLK